jgi:hypothetical protein
LYAKPNYMHDCTEVWCFSRICGLLRVRQPELYNLQCEMLPKVAEYARTVVADSRPQMREPACLAFDESWSHWRYAREHTVDFIDCDSGLTIDFEIITLDNHHHHRDYPRQIISLWVANHKVSTLCVIRTRDGGKSSETVAGMSFKFSIQTIASSLYPETAYPGIERAAH